MDFTKVCSQFHTTQINNRQVSLSGISVKKEEKPVSFGLVKSEAKDGFKSSQNKEDKRNLKEFLALILSPIPFARRIMPIEKNSDDNNTVKAVGLGVIGAINMKEDIRDILTIAGKTQNTSQKGYYSMFRFFTGTYAEVLFKKNKLGKFILRNLDKSIGETRIGDKVLRALKVTTQLDVAIKDVFYFKGKKESLLRPYIKFEGSRMGKLVGLTLYRIPILSVLVASALEIPDIIKSKEKGKQLIKSAMNSTIGITGGAICSAMLVPIHPALSVMGFGFGCYLGNKISKKIGENI